ncbi:MAG: HyaD/HybD family hydrogenase maturation endopeptidase [Rhodomicrobium sp.]
MRDSMRAVVLGVGNILLSDEGIGVHAVNALAARYELPPEVEIIDGGTSAMDCLDRIASSDLLLIADCVHGGREPGALIRLGDGELQVFFRTKISPHQVGLSDVLATLALHGLSPSRTVLIGAEPESFALGLEPTPELAATLPAMVEALAAELAAAGIGLQRREAPVAAE